MKTFGILVSAGLAILPDVAMTSGVEGVPETTGISRASAASTSAAPVADLNGIQAELRSLRAEVAELRRQLAGVTGRPTPALSTAPPQTPTRPEVKPVPVTLKEAPRHALGRSDAPVVLVEFTDYQCGYCRRFFETTFPLLKRDFIDTGKLRFVSRNMPAPAHAQAEPAALALLKAAERTDDDYWKMRAWLFNNQRSLGPVAYARYADETGLDRAAILEAITAKKRVVELHEDIAAAQTAGITATPSFVLGTSDGRLIQGERITGAKSFPIFESKIRALLVKAETPAPR